MRYSSLFMLLVIAGCVVHVDRAQTPDLAIRYFESGQKKFDEQDWVAAADSFTRAIQINALSKGVKSAKHRGNAFDQSRAETSEISVSDKFTARAYVNRGSARFYSGAFDQSIADYECALRIDP
jgi:tetratricopeptide (TPR) repeat protein